MNKVDVLIVGGGPGGLSAAEIAAKRGCRTLILEQEKEIGRPVHTSGGISVQSMKEFGVPEQHYHVVDTLKICSPNKTALFSFDKPTMCIIDVTGMYKFLANRAESVGATIQTGVHVIEPIMKNGFVTGCRTKSNVDNFSVVDAKIVIDASGYRSTISKGADLHSGFTRFGVGAEYELIAPECKQNEAVIIVGNRYAPSGYAWVFPWGQQRVRVGVGILHTDSTANPKDHLEIFVNEADKFGVNLANHQIIESHFGLIPSDGLAPHFVGNGIMAVGDAAGQASLVVGEGIRLSIIAGEMAGEVAAAAIKSGHFDKQTLYAYERIFKKRYDMELKIGYIMNRKMAQWDDSEWDDKVQFIQSIPTYLFAEILQSQFTLKNIFSFVATHPSMWPRALRYTVKGVLQYILK